MKIVATALGLVALGVLAGFVTKLIWPSHRP